MRLDEAPCGLDVTAADHCSNSAAGCDVAQEMIEIRRVGARILRRLVVTAQPHGFRVQGIAPEVLDLVSRHRPALQAEAAHRIGRELAEIAGLDSAEIT